MDQKNDRRPHDQPIQAEVPAARKRFRIEKLEERIAPDKGGIPHTGNHHGGSSATDSGFSIVSGY